MPTRGARRPSRSGPWRPGGRCGRVPDPGAHGGGGPGGPGRHWATWSTGGSAPAPGSPWWAWCSASPPPCSSPSHACDACCEAARPRTRSHGGSVRPDRGIARSCSPTSNCPTSPTWPGGPWPWCWWSAWPPWWPACPSTSRCSGLGRLHRSRPRHPQLPDDRPLGGPGQRQRGGEQAPPPGHQHPRAGWASSPW